MAEPKLCEIPVELVLVDKGGESSGNVFHAELTIKYYQGEGGTHGFQDMRIIQLHIPSCDVLRFWEHMGEAINRNGEICGAPECRHGKFFHFDESGVCEVVGCTCICFVKSETPEMVIKGDIPADPSLLVNPKEPKTIDDDDHFSLKSAWEDEWHKDNFEPPAS